MGFRQIWVLLKEVGHGYSRHHGGRLSAALAYYALFSLAPLLVIATLIASFFFTREAIRAGIINEVNAVAGPLVAGFVKGLLARSAHPEAGLLATVLSLGVLLYSAANLFEQLQDALNTIWGIRQRPGRILDLIRQRMQTFLMVAIAGLLVFFSLTASAALNLANRWFTNFLPGVEDLLPWVSFLGTLLVFSLAFYLLFRFLPDVRVKSGIIWTGAAVTSVLFNVGNLLIGIYLQRASLASTYGAAGSLAAMLLWAYYSAQIFFLGAEFTRVLALHSEQGILPPAAGTPRFSLSRRIGFYLAARTIRRLHR
jgi:membrane protein